MGLFKRLVTLGKSEANAIVDKLEDPIKMTEQGIKDLKKDLDASLKGLAEVKALAIRSKRDLSTATEKANNYEQKAILLLKKAESGGIAVEEADRLATEALQLKEQAMKDAARAKTEVDKFDQNVANLNEGISRLRSSISSCENELRTLKARARVSAATQKINKQLSGIDSSSTVTMLERMKEKVEQQEAMSEAYADIAGQPTSIDSEIDKALGGSTPASSSALEALKAKLNQS